MELDTNGWELNTTKIKETARYDYFYAVITNNVYNLGAFGYKANEFA